MSNSRRHSATTAGGIQIALLRGVNVGRGNRIAMAHLRTMVESIGGVDVQTVLNSGNVVYRSTQSVTAMARAMEAELASHLPSPIKVTVFAAKEFARVVIEDPFDGIADNLSRHLMYAYYEARVAEQLKPLARADWNGERIHLGRQFAHVWLPNGIINSRLAKAIDRTVGDRVTARNRATMQKLNDLATAMA